MKRILIITISLIVFSNASFAQKEKYQSIFIYNFTKYIKWPDSYKPDKFIIGVYGNSQMFDELVTMVDLKKKSGSGAKMEVQQYESIADIDDCSILFVSVDVVDKLATIDTTTTSKPMLIITDSPGKAIEGSVINFVLQDGKVKFELNTEKAAGRGLVVSNTLAKLAIVI